MTDQIATGTPEREGFSSNSALGNVDDFRMTGYVTHAIHRGIEPRLDVPLITHVKDGLWQGGCIGGVLLPHDFNYVLSLYPWEKYVLGPNTERDEVKMYDSLDQGFEQVDQIAHEVADRLDDGEKVLVHCQAGCNRSGLLAARTLMVKDGMPASDAIALLRETRSPLVLCNEAFENWLLSL